MQERITVTLDNYVLLSPEAINLDEANRAKLQAVMNAEPLALIEYWAVDPDYDGQVFRSVWQDYRGNVDNDGDSLRVVTQAVLTVPAKTERRVCVRGGGCVRFRGRGGDVGRRGGRAMSTSNPWTIGAGRCADETRRRCACTLKTAWLTFSIWSRRRRRPCCTGGSGARW